MPELSLGIVPFPNVYMKKQDSTNPLDAGRISQESLAQLRQFGAEQRDRKLRQR